MPDDISVYLQSEWRQLVTASPIDKAGQYFSALLEAYSEPYRAYHNCQHLVHILGLLREAGARDQSLFWAAFYHDYCYVPGAGDNEARSADIARAQMAAMMVESDLVSRTCALILATKSHQMLQADHEAALFLDADMAILGAPHDQYRQYQLEVRKEFGRVPQILFNHGRKKFLRQLLAQDRIYFSHWFFNLFEAQARLNIRWELEVE